MVELTLATIAEKLDTLLAQSQQPEPRFLTVDAAAAYCSLSPESIRRLLSAGKLTKLHPVRGRVTIDRRELDSYVLTATGTLRRGRGSSVINPQAGVRGNARPGNPKP